MPKSSRQLDREIAEALNGSSQASASRVRYTVHGAKRGGNAVRHTESPAEADRLARALARKDFTVTVLEQDPQTREYRAVMHSNRRNGKQEIEILDPSFARAAGR